jgi:chemotaxis protein methyltransferase CheR
MEDQDYLAFIKNIKQSTSIDLSQYKEAQMKRRLTALRDKKGYSTFVAFYDAMMKDKLLFHEFLDRMTINVSEFWRNPNRWEVLASRFIPEMSKQSRRLKCFSAACSTGEEPYSLAMILAEQQLLSSSTIIAADIDDGALEKARNGLYIDRSIRDVPANYLKKYFQQDHVTYKIEEALKKHINFQKKNLLIDPYESNFDLIICRNVMIYFTEEAKDILYHKFSQALKPGGILFVGSTEQIFSPGRYQLEVVDTFFYRKCAEPVKS